MLMVLKALAVGMNRTISSRGVLLPLYLSNLAISAVLALMFFHTLSAAFGDSRASLALLSGFDSTIVGDLRRMVPDAFPDYLRIVGIGSLFYVLLNTFLVGGVISTLQAGALVPQRGFLHSCAKFFGRFFRLFLLTASIAVIFTALFLVLGGFLIASISRTAGTETPLFLVAAVVGMVILACLLLLVMIADYTKIGIVLHNSRSITRAFGMSFRFFSRNPKATLALQVVLLSIGILVAALHALLWTLPHVDSVVIMVVGFLLHQALLLMRITTRVFSFGAESALLETLQPVDTSSPPEETGPGPTHSA